MSRTLTEYAIRWEPAPPYPDMSKSFLARGEAERALRESAFDGEIVQRTVTYGEWEPVISENYCGNCWKCLDGGLTTGYILCQNCGNKRCPKASDHRFDCTRSNEPGQPGSVYPAAKDLLGIMRSDGRTVQQIIEDIRGQR